MTADPCHCEHREAIQALAQRPNRWIATACGLAMTGETYHEGN